jgi:hypothetical protein
VEVSIRDRANAEFSHGVCPDCAKWLYPDLYHELDLKGQENLKSGQDDKNIKVFFVCRINRNYNCSNQSGTQR